MKAVILAAGKGKRMRPLTFTTPKPLLKINGKPILQHTLEQLKGLVDEVLVVVGYKGDMIKEYFGDEFEGLRIKYVYQEKPMGTGHALLQVKDYIKGRFLMMYGDDIYHAKDIERCLEYDLSMLVQKVGDPRRFGVVIIEDGKAKDIIEKPEEPISNTASVGVFVLNHTIFDLLEDLTLSKRGEYELPDAIRRFIKFNEVYCIPVENIWIPIAYPEDLKAAEERLKCLKN